MLSTQLMIPNYPVIPSHQRNMTVSLETSVPPLFIWLEKPYFGLTSLIEHFVCLSKFSLRINFDYPRTNSLPKRIGGMIKNLAELNEWDYNNQLKLRALAFGSFVPSSLYKRSQTTPKILQV